MCAKNDRRGHQLFAGFRTLMSPYSILTAVQCVDTFRFYFYFLSMLQTLHSIGSKTFTKSKTPTTCLRKNDASLKLPCYIIAIRPTTTLNLALFILCLALPHNVTLRRSGRAPCQLTKIFLRSVEKRIWS